MFFFFILIGICVPYVPFYLLPIFDEVDVAVMLIATTYGMFVLPDFIISIVFF